MNRGTVICDLDGVVYLGDQPVPGSADALGALERDGWLVLFATNNATRTPDETAAKIRRVGGYPARADQVIGSAEAAAALLAGQARHGFVVGTEGLRAALRAAGCEPDPDWRKADAVVVGLDPSVSYADLRDATLAVRSGARFVATNLDASFPTPGGQWPGAGALVAAVATASGVQPEPAGKPFQPMIDLIRARIAGAGITDGPVVVVGDRPETDLAMARRAGWSSVAVLTGVIDDAGQIPASLAPDVVLGSLAELPAWLAEREMM